MGRGLSELQKTMLELAWNKYQEHRRMREEFKNNPKLLEEWHSIYTDMNYNPYNVPEKFKIVAKDNWLGFIGIEDVFIKYYGWTPKYEDRDRKYFSKAEIGNKMYMAAYIAVRKSLDRLGQRGLIDVNHSRGYYYLTSEGKQLMAKPAK